MSKYQGESERLIKTLFQMARDNKPSIIFIDEIDSLCGARNEGQSESSKRVLTEFLVQMQGVGHDMKGVLVLGATNLPWGLDSAIRRRFVKRVLIPLPDYESRKQIVSMTLKDALKLSDTEIDSICNRTEGYNASDVVNMINDAKYSPLRKVTSARYFKRITINNKEKWTPVSPIEFNKDPQNVKEMRLTDLNDDNLHYPLMAYDDIEESLERFRPSVNHEDIRKCDEWTKEFGESGAE